MHDRTIFLRIYIQIIFCGLLVLLSFSEILSAESLKALSNNVSLAEQVEISINGVPTIVKAPEQIVLVRGDKFKITAIKSLAGVSVVDSINVVGFVNKELSANDTGIEISSDKDLLEKYAMGEDRSMYRVLGYSKGQPVAEVNLKLIEPKLYHAELELNKKTSVWREGEVVKLNSIDKLKLKKLVTNLGDQSSKVKVSLVPLTVSGSKDFAGYKLYEMQFKHQAKVFAKIPIQVEGL